MAKNVSDKTMTRKSTAAGKRSGGLKNPLARVPSLGSVKPSQAPRGAVSTKPVGRVRTFLREVRIEMTKVTWPPRKELLTATGVVIVAVIIAGVYIGVFDFIWNLIVRAVKLG